MAQDPVWNIELELFSRLSPVAEHPVNPNLVPEIAQVPTKKASKWATSEDSPFKADLRNASSFPDIGDIKWDAAEFKGVERSEKGTEGLFFVEAKNGIFIVKRSSNIASELFCSLLSVRLGGLRPPKMRIVSGNSEEGNQLLICLKELDKSFRVYTTLANQTNILIMEFIRGITLNKVTATTGPEVLQKSVLHQLGSLMALDVLTNNSDRLPIAWTNEGNFDNIMLDERGGTIVPIDSKVIPLDKDHPYGNRVRELLRTILVNPSHESSQFHTIRDLFVLYTGHNIGSEGSVFLQEGFIETVKKCASIDLKDLEAEMRTWEEALKTHYGLTINEQVIPFVLRIAQLFHDAIHDPSFSLTPPSSSSQPSSSSNSSQPSHTTSSHQVSLANISECSWHKVVVPTEKPAPRRYHSGVLYEGKLYVFGGVCVKTASNDFYVFDFDAKKWSTVVAQGAAPSPRCGHSAVVFEKKMWIFGGHDNNRHPFNDLFCFDFVHSKWEKIEGGEGEAWPSPRYHHSATLVGSSWYIFGGSASKLKYFNDLYVFKFGENKWSHAAPHGDIPDPRAGHFSVEWNGSLLFFGGYGGDGGYTPFVDTYALELATHIFQEIDLSGTFPRTARPLSYTPYYFGEGPNKEGAVYVFGGSDGKSPLGSLFQWNLKTNKWRVVKAWMTLEADAPVSALTAVASGKMDPVPRYGHCTVLDDAGNLTIFGGSGSLFLDDVVQFVLVD